MPPTALVFSVFASAYETTPAGETSLEHFIGQIRSGIYSKAISKVRAGEMDKEKLAAASLSGTFSVRSSAGLKAHSGLLQIDIDAKDNPGVDMAKLQQDLKSDPYCVAAFRSARGQGLKVVVRIAGQRHKESAVAAAEYFKVIHGVVADPSCKDVSRLCFVSDDPEAWVKPPIERNAMLPLPAAGAVPEGAGSKVIPDKTFAYNSPEEEGAAITRVEEVLSFIPTRPKYPEWLIVLSGVFDELPYHHAVAVLNAWSIEEDENQYEKKYSVRLKEIGFGSVMKMAIAGGYDNSPAKRRERAVRKFPDLSGVDDDDISDNPEPNPGAGAAGAPAPGGAPAGGASAAGPKDKPKILVHLGEVNDVKCAPEFVKSLLSVGGLSVLYGPGNVGKSFLWQDLAAHVARGIKWRNGEVIVRGGPVIYFALEGSFGVRKRILAMKQRGILPHDDLPLDLCFMPVRMLEDGKGRGAAVVSDAIKECEDHWQQAVRWVILDTLARTMAGGDENATKDMGKVVAECDIIRNKHLGTAVGAIHHSGKDADRGMRGNTSLYDGVDTVIEVYRPPDGDIITATVRKQRELDFREPMPFRLDTVELGRDDDGDPITSCVCVHLRPEEGTVRGSAGASGGRGGSGGSGGRGGKKPRVPVHQILGLLPQASKKEWVKKAEAVYGVSQATFYRSLDEIKGQNRYETKADGSVILKGDKYGFEGGDNGGENDGTSDNN
jgi:hypothetical protein